MSAPRPLQYLPPEWTAQQAIMLTWPHAGGPWGEALAEIDSTFHALARAISRRQRVIIACHDWGLLQRLQRSLPSCDVDLGRVELFVAPNDDVWARDHGPMTVRRDGRRVLLDFRFNGWGGKYPACLDDAVTVRLWRAGAFGVMTREPVDLVLEGGSIEVDGAGTLLTTSSCLLAPTRNPGLSPQALEARLKALLGISTIHWLRHGELLGDDTDGHIDTLARFADACTIVYQGCDDSGDAHFGPLARMAEELRALRRADGQPYELHALPLPRPVFAANGERLPAGYANFLIINGAVLMPSYADPADRIAAHILQRCFPEREIVAIDARPLIRQYGSVHCVAMQIPAA